MDEESHPIECAVDDAVDGVREAIFNALINVKSLVVEKYAKIENRPPDVGVIEVLDSLVSNLKKNYQGTTGKRIFRSGYWTAVREIEKECENLKQKWGKL